MLGPTAHIDTFSRDNLPEESMQPDFLLDKYRAITRLLFICRIYIFLDRWQPSKL